MYFIIHIQKLKEVKLIGLENLLLKTRFLILLFRQLFDIHSYSFEKVRDFEENTRKNEYASTTRGNARHKWTDEACKACKANWMHATFKKDLCEICSNVQSAAKSLENI